MARKKNIELASRELRDFHTLDEARIDALRSEWDEPTPLESIKLPNRPERGYKRGRGIVDVILCAGGENGFNAHRSHYGSINGVVADPDQQLSYQEALDAFLLETRDGKYTSMTWPDQHKLLKVGERLSAEAIAERFRDHMRDYGQSNTYYGVNYSIIQYLGGLLGVLIGPLATVELWMSELTSAVPPNIFPYLGECASEEDEARLTAICEQITRDTPLEAWTYWHMGALSRVPDMELLERVIKTRPDLFNIGEQSKKMLIATGCKDTYVEKLRASAFMITESSMERFAAFDALDTIAAAAPRIAKYKGVTDKKNAMKALSKLHLAALTPSMLDLYKDKKVGKLAEAWLLHEGANAIVGLADNASNKSKKGKLATELLCRYRDMGHGELINDLVEAHCDAKVNAFVHKHVLEHYMAEKETVSTAAIPPWFEQLISDASMRRKSLPKFLELEGLPPVQTKSREVLGSEEVEWLVRVLKESTLDTPHEAIEHYRIWLDEFSVQEFAHALFDSWMRAGSNATYSWMVGALGHFGSLYTPAMLVKPMKKWRYDSSESKRKLHALSCDVLKALFLQRGHATALRSLLDLGDGQHWRQRGKSASESVLDDIATALGVSREDLEDVAVPSLGFNPRGERDFDYGPRQFTLRLDETLSAVFVARDGSGKVSKSLPRPRKDDDAEKVDLAKIEYKRDKKLLSTTIERQTERFREAMLSRHKWSVDTWSEYILRHPLIKNFARRLLWKGRSRTTQEAVVFRVTEEFELADVSDECVTLEEFHDIQLLERGALSLADRSAWAELFADYEVVQPFEQI